MEERKGFLDFAESVPDPRNDKNKLYPVGELLLLTVCAVICGADSWDDIELYGLNKLETLRKNLPFDNGIPSDDTLRRFFRALDPEAFRKAFVDWVKTLSNIPETLVVAIDGKTSRRSFDADSPALHTVSAFASGVGIVLGQTGTKGKGREIEGILELLGIIDLKGAVVTIDAIGTQRKIAEKIVNSQADYILALKGNQGNAHQDVIEFFRDPSKMPDVYVAHDKGHGRIEKRVCSVLSGADVTGYIDWPGLSAIVKVERHRESKGKTESETAYYLASLKNDAKTIGEKIRGHWGVENSLHHVLDVSFGDDDSRIRKGHAPKNMTIVKHAVLNMIKKAKKPRESIKGTRKKAGWNDKVLVEILAG